MSIYIRKHVLVYNDPLLIFSILYSSSCRVYLYSLQKPPFLDLHLSIANGFVSSKIYDKRDNFDFDIVNFPFLDGDVLLMAYTFHNSLGLLESAIM